MIIIIISSYVNENIQSTVKIYVQNMSAIEKLIVRIRFKCPLTININNNNKINCKF